MRNKTTSIPQYTLVYHSILTLLMFSLLIGVVSAEQQSLGTVKQNQCIILKQTCANCTFVNVTSVIYPNTTQAQGVLVMAKTGSEYNVSYCRTGVTGTYTYNTLGNPDGTNVVQPVTFEVTPSGLEGVLGLFIIVIFMIYAIGFFGFFGKHEWIAILGGMAMIILGIYMFNNGIDVYKTAITNVLSLVTIGLGAIFAISSGAHIIEENM